jgi:UDP-N-acetylglucosamine transferase subunit ALG13
MVRWARRLGVAATSRYVTFDSAQSRSLLAGQPYDFVEYVAPRDWRTLARATVAINRVASRERFEFVLSTGAGVALGGRVVAARRQLPFHYIESVSRFDGPSLSGRILARLPLRQHLYTQHRQWSGANWRYAGSVLDDYVAEAKPLSEGPLRLFVTLGTIRPYRFDALVDQVLALARPGDTVVWQLGETTRTNLPGTVHQYVTAAEFDRECLAADVVITHAGVGSMLRMTEMGLRPVVVPRRAIRGEHVDDHQLQAAGEFGSRMLAVSREVHELTREDILTARAVVAEVV